MVSFVLIQLLRNTMKCSCYNDEFIFVYSKIRTLYKSLLSVMIKPQYCFLFWSTVVLEFQHLDKIIHKRNEKEGTTGRALRHSNVDFWRLSNYEPYS